MTIVEAKEKLKKEGYTSFNLKDFNEEFYNFLLHLKCNEEKNLKSKMNMLRMDIGTQTDLNSGSKQIQTTKAFDSYELANNYAELTIKDCYENNELVNFTQYWYYNDLSTILISDEMKTYNDGIFNIVSYLYDTNNYQLNTHTSQLTYYPKDCFLTNHSDGYGTGRICALLIYLNENYNEENGGILILNNNEKIIPIFGKVVIIDLQSFDIPHEVTKVLDGIGRYACISFVKDLF